MRQNVTPVAFTDGRFEQKRSARDLRVRFRRERQSGGRLSYAVKITDGGAWGQPPAWVSEAAIPIICWLGIALVRVLEIQ